MLQFRILGPLEVADEADAVPVGGRKQRALLAILLLNANRVVSTDQLVDELWSGQAPRTAMTSLQNSISQLRKLLGPEVVTTRPPGYVLNVHPRQLDLTRFERLARDARGAGPEERARALRDALELWRGPPLAEFAFQSFAQTDIRRLEELRLSTHEDRIEAELELGLHSELAGELESLVAHHPLRERLRAQLMLALYRSGRQAEALRAYQDGRRSLVDELGIEPSSELQQLHGAILRQETKLTPRAAVRDVDDHYGEVAKAILAGRVVPLLGSDVADLASRLADRFEYPVGDGVELARVSQYVAVMKGFGPLYDELHETFDTDAVPTPVHGFFAALPAALRERGVPHQLIVTTSYDLALEQSFLDAGEELDIVSYVASGRNRGRFCHVPPGEPPRLIEIPNTYATELSLDRRSVVLKLHGQVDRAPQREWESFVITEDDYIDYLAQNDISTVVPVSLAVKLRRSHFLFLGYTMRDWNLRVLLNRIWGDQKVGYRSWAVHRDASPIEQAFWRQRDVELVDMPLDEYVEGLGERLARLRGAEAAA